MAELEAKGNVGQSLNLHLDWESDGTIGGATVRSSGACAIVGLIVFALLIGLPQNGRAADYTFTKIADTNSGFFSSFGGEPPINNAGTVAFFACLDATCASMGIFAGSGGAVETIVDTSGDFFQFTGDIAINDVGVVAFIGRIDGGLQGIFADTGALLTTIAQRLAPAPSLWHAARGAPAGIMG